MGGLKGKQKGANAVPAAVLAPIVAAGGIAGGAMFLLAATPPKAEEPVLTRPTDQVCQRYSSKRAYKPTEVSSFDIAGLRLGMSPDEVQEIMLCGGMKLNNVSRGHCAADWIENDRGWREAHANHTINSKSLASNCVEASRWYEDKRDINVLFVEDVQSKIPKMVAYEITSQQSLSLNEATLTAFKKALIEKYGRPSDFSDLKSANWGSYDKPQLRYFTYASYYLTLSDSSMSERLKKVRSKFISDAKPKDEPKL